YTRLAATAPVNSIMPLPAPTPDDAVLPFMDPAFATAVCRYDLAAGPLKLRVPVSQAYTSVSFYARSGIAYYAINDRAAGRRVIELDLMTSAQRADAPKGIPDLAFPEIADIGEAARALQVEIGNRAGHRDERPDQPAVAVHVFDQPVVRRGLRARERPQQNARIFGVVIIEKRRREQV